MPEPTTPASDASGTGPPPESHSPMSAGRRMRRFARRFRPLDPLRSIKLKLGVLVMATVSVCGLIIWALLYRQVDSKWTLVLAVLGSLILTQVLATGMTSPLREMTRAAKAMAKGDYSIRVTATSRDEVGQLAEAFNRMAEDLGSVDVMRREVIANVSHELRTPIAALQAQLENIVDGVEEPTEATMQTALAQTERLGRLVTYLLDLSRIEAGDSGLEIRDLALAPFLKEVADGAAMVSSSSARNVTWRVSVSPQDLTVPADSERLHQVLANLCHNAYRHSPDGGVVTISAKRPMGADHVTIEVADRGEGVPPELREKVFERFQRGNAPNQTGTTSTGGTGLGLAIARWAVDLHGGTIDITDTPGGGATFRIQLPTVRAIDHRWPKVTS